MGWMKWQLSDEDVTSKAVLTVINEMGLPILLGTDPAVSVLVRDVPGTQPIYFFSPAVTKRFTAILERRGAIPCDPPAKEDVTKALVGTVEDGRALLP